MSARTFAVVLLHGNNPSSSDVNIPAVLLPLLQAMAQTETDTWYSIFPSSSSEFLC